MKVNCPSCNQKYNITDDMFGQKLQCQACDEPMIFKAPKSIAEPTPAKQPAPTERETGKIKVNSESSVTKVKCPGCSQKYNITPAQYGQNIECQACEYIIVVDAPAGSVKPSHAVTDFHANKKSRSPGLLASGIAAAALIGGGYFAFNHYNTQKDVETLVADTSDKNIPATDNNSGDKDKPTATDKPSKPKPEKPTKVAEVKPAPKVEPVKPKTIASEFDASEFTTEPTEPTETTEQGAVPVATPKIVSNSKYSKLFNDQAVPFFKKHCIECHGPDKEKGSLRVDQLIANLDDNYTLNHLQNIVDEMTVDNMPPEEEPRPDGDEVTQIIKILTAIEKEAKELHTAGGGRPVRRLTRTEFLNTTEDLLGVVSSTMTLPDDLYVGDFETRAETLFLTDMHVNLYLDRSRQLVKRFIQSRSSKPGNYKIKTPYSPLLKRSIFAFDTSSTPTAGHLSIRTHWYVKNPAGKGKTTVGSSDGGPIYTITGTKGSPQTIDFKVNKPRAQLSWAIKKSDKKSVKSFTGSRNDTKKKISQLEKVKITDSNLVKVQEGLLTHPVVLSKIEHIVTVNPQPYNFFKQFLKSGDDLPDEAAPAIIAKFSALVKRGRGVDPAYVEMLNKVFIQGRSQGMSFWQALEEPMAFSICSIDSILHFENRNTSNKSRTVNGVELANRLSYMLWRSAPDGELVRLGKSGELLDPATKAKQIKRMMDDKKFDRFIHDFSDQWLELPRQEEIAVDETIYTNFNSSLKKDMRRETIEFMSHIIKNNLPILNVIDSNFMVINEPMAKHYGIKGVKGKHFRPVNRGYSTADRARGGILTHAGILMQGTTGDRTSIVERGAFIARKIINQPPADPPPLVGELATNNAASAKMTGAELVKEHAKNRQCANCHAGIDPLGMGLEEYDVVGLVRKKEIRPNPILGTLGKVAKRNPKNHTITVRLDTKGRLYDGQRYEGTKQMKKVLISKKHDMAEGYIMALLSYTNGRNAGLTDATIVKELAKKTANTNYPARTIIETIANSDVMLRF